MSVGADPVFVVQHTAGEFLGLIEDHLEGRGIRFTYFRPFTAGGGLPATLDFCAGLILLGGGPWGTRGGRAVPTLTEELELTRGALELGKPVIGFGLGAQILAIAAGGGADAAPFAFEFETARRVEDDALNGFLPETFHQVTYMRDWPRPPVGAAILARDEQGRPSVFRVGDNSFGFVANPGIKLGMVEDLIMEFDEVPDGAAEKLEQLRGLQGRLEDELVPIMTGLVQCTALMTSPKAGRNAAEALDKPVI